MIKNSNTNPENVNKIASIGTCKGRNSIETVGDLYGDSIITIGNFENEHNIISPGEIRNKAAKTGKFRKKALQFLCAAALTAAAGGILPSGFSGSMVCQAAETTEIAESVNVSAYDINFFEQMKIDMVSDHVLAAASKTVVLTGSLKQGATGYLVAVLQKELNAVLGCNLTEDGVFGPATKKQVMAYQKKAGEKVDGWAGSCTWRHLNSDYAKLFTNLAITSTTIKDFNVASKLAALTYEKQGTSECVLTSISDCVNTELALEGKIPQVTKYTVRYIYNGGLNASWSKLCANINANSGVEKSFTYKSVNGMTVKDMTNILNSHPSGVVIFCKGANGKTHAVYLRGVYNGKIYVSDPVNSAYTFVPLTGCSLASSYYGKSEAAILGTVVKVLYFQ